MLQKNVYNFVYYCCVYISLCFICSGGIFVYIGRRERGIVRKKKEIKRFYFNRMTVKVVVVTVAVKE